MGGDGPVGVVRILDEVEDGDAIADGRQQTGAIGGEQQVSSAVDGPQQVGELAQGQRARHGGASRAVLTWKSVFMVQGRCRQNQRRRLSCLSVVSGLSVLSAADCLVPVAS